MTLWQVQQDKQKKYTDQIGRRNHELFSVENKVLSSTRDLPKHTVLVIPSVILSYFRELLGFLVWFLEVIYLNHRLTFPPYTKTHPFFVYVGHIKRYANLQETAYSHGSNVNDRVEENVANNCTAEVTASRKHLQPTRDLPILEIGDR